MYVFIETVLMKGHNVCFTGKILKIISTLSLLPLLNWSTDESCIMLVYGLAGLDMVDVTATGDMYCSHQLPPS